MKFKEMINICKVPISAWHTSGFERLNPETNNNKSSRALATLLVGFQLHLTDRRYNRSEGIKTKQLGYCFPFPLSPLLLYHSGPERSHIPLRC